MLGGSPHQGLHSDTQGREQPGPSPRKDTGDLAWGAVMDRGTDGAQLRLRSRRGHSGNRSLPQGKGLVGGSCLRNSPGEKRGGFPVPPRQVKDELPGLWATPEWALVSKEAPPGWADPEGPGARGPHCCPLWAPPQGKAEGCVHTRAVT